MMDFLKKWRNAWRKPAFLASLTASQHDLPIDAMRRANGKHEEALWYPRRWKPHRVHVLILLVIVMACVLAVRAFYLYWVMGAFLKEQGEKRTLRTLELPAYRGIIRDRHGVPLAVSTPVISLWCDPSQVPRDDATLRRLADGLGVSLSSLQARLTENSNRDFLYLKRQVAPEFADIVLNEDIPGVQGSTEYKRFYPAGEVVAQVVGLTDLDQHGQEGVELSFDRMLSGEPGAYTIIKDRHQRMIEQLGLSKPPRPGQDVQLSIDLRFQYQAWQALQRAVTVNKAQAGTLVALDVRSGAVLAMVSSPSVNPNDRAHLASEALRNRVITDVFEPGSTMKPFSVLAALDTGRYDPTTLLDTSPGYITISGKQIRDFRNYGLLDVTGILTKSSNVGVVRLALDMPDQQLSTWFDRLGFGQATGVNLPGERDGTLPIWRQPKKLDRATLSFGYGLSVTALQLARAYAAIASGGVLKPVTVLLREEEPMGERVMGAGLALEVTRMLQTVVAPGGTAVKAAIAGYHVAGKTGTVYKMTPTGYADDQY
ncbi:MAG: penicillin-binding transpeptidase domain-containing protein, partial [Gammaproteobacteria bacterium]